MTAINRRLVLFFPGFEPLSLQVHSARFQRGAEMAAGVWGAHLEEGSPPPGEPNLPSAAGRLRYELSGDGWRTHTQVVVCDWSETIAIYAKESGIARFARGLEALFDFAASGTAWRYFRTSWRYGLFYLFPFIVLASIGILAGLAAALPAFADLSLLHLLWSIPLGALTAALAVAVSIRKLHFLTLMSDWAFARDLAHGTEPAIETRIAAHAETIRRELEAGDFDEIVVAGHSLGVGIAILALARALSKTKPRAPVHILSVGSSLLKTALHPAATDQREAVRQLVEDHRLLWVDVQSLSDPLNFYRSNPARSLGISGGPAPVVKRISLGKLVLGRTRRRMKFDLFRRHRQFVYGSEKRHAYSFHMILIGPVPFPRFAQTASVDQPPLVARTPRAAEALPEVPV